MEQNLTNSTDLISNSSVPYDLALKIASFLEPSDLCSLGSCSSFWKLLCATDSLWKLLFIRRWPLSGDELLASPFQSSRALYIDKHKKVANAVSTVIQFVEQSIQDGSLEVNHYLKSIHDLNSMDLGFEDVQIFFFKRQHNVLLNLIGLHYSIFWLNIQPSNMIKVLESCQVADRQVRVNWYKLGRWFYGFRLPDENQSRKVSLGELSMSQNNEVLGVLNRGAIYEVLRVQISSVTISSK